MLAPTDSKTPKRKFRNSQLGNPPAIQLRADLNDVAIRPLNAVGRFIYYALAGFFLLLGFVGAFLPVLPTTPFLLLSSFFLIRVSPALHGKLLRLRLVGPILQEWHEHRGVRPQVKIRAVLMVIAVVGISLGVSQPAWWVAATVVAVATGGLCVIWRLPSCRPSAP